jgi:hypothetical protein
MAHPPAPVDSARPDISPGPVNHYTHIYQIDRAAASAFHPEFAFRNISAFAIQADILAIIQ